MTLFQSTCEQRKVTEWGFSLAEVTLAIGVAAFCLLTLFGLLPVGINSNQASMEQTAASSITRSIVADLRNTPSSGTSPFYGFVVPAAGGVAVLRTVYFSENGVKTGLVGAVPVTTGTSISRYRGTVYFIPPAANQKTATTVRILITWPALVNPVPTTDPTIAPIKYSGSVDTNTSLNRN